VGLHVLGHLQIAQVVEHNIEALGPPIASSATGPA